MPALPEVGCGRSSGPEKAKRAKRDRSSQVSQDPRSVGRVTRGIRVPKLETWNPTFELAYWVHGLQTAQMWRERLGMKRSPAWDDVVSKLSSLPVKDGVYLAHENCPQTHTERNYDHPSMLGALGMLPGDRVDRATMRSTLGKVMREWQWEKTWGGGIIH